MAASGEDSRGEELERSDEQRDEEQAAGRDTSIDSDADGLDEGRDDDGEADAAAWCVERFGFDPRSFPVVTEQPVESRLDMCALPYELRAIFRDDLPVLRAAHAILDLLVRDVVGEEGARQAPRALLWQRGTALLLGEPSCIMFRLNASVGAVMQTRACMDSATGELRAVGHSLLNGSSIALRPDAWWLLADELRTLQDSQRAMMLTTQRGAVLPEGSDRVLDIIHANHKTYVKERIRRAT